jgi:hypothetical protein
MAPVKSMRYCFSREKERRAIKARLVLLRKIRPERRLRRVQGDVDLQRPVGGQGSDQRLLQQGGVGGEVEAVGQEPFPHQVHDREETGVEEGLPLRDPARQGVAQVDAASVRGRHQGELELDVLHVPEEVLLEGKGVHPVGAEEAAGIAGGAEGKLLRRLSGREPFLEKGALCRLAKHCLPPCGRNSLRLFFHGTLPWLVLLDRPVTVRGRGSSVKPWRPGVSAFFARAWPQELAAQVVDPLPERER